MKGWILQTFFKEELKELFKEASIDAFSKAYKDLEETNVYNTDEKAKELTEERLSNLLSLIDKKRIVTLDKNSKNIYVGGKLADDGRLKNLKSEAEFLVQSDIWGIINETPKELAQKAMFVDGENIESMRKGRAMLYLLDSQNKIIDIFKGYTHVKS